MNCLLIRELPFGLAMRLWDTYLAEGTRMKVRTLPEVVGGTDHMCSQRLRGHCWLCRRTHCLARKYKRMPPACLGHLQ